MDEKMRAEFELELARYAPWEKGAPICSERYDGIEGRDAATRLAITRAAAEIERSMP